MKSYPTNFNALHIHITDTLEALGVPKNPEPVRHTCVTRLRYYLTSLTEQWHQRRFSYDLCDR